MPKLTYEPKTPDDPEETSSHSVSFSAGEAVEVSDAVYEALKDNPWFRTDEAAESDAVASPDVGEGQPDSSVNVQYPPGVGMKTHPDAVKTEEGFVAPDSPEARAAGNEVADDGSGGDDLKAVHRGRGSWSIMRGDEEVREGLVKADAEAFNAMSAEDRAEYVKAGA